jgi:hypothetical protein
MGEICERKLSVDTQQIEPEERCHDRLARQMRTGPAKPSIRRILWARQQGSVLFDTGVPQWDAVEAFVLLQCFDTLLEQGAILVFHKLAASRKLDQGYGLVTDIVPHQDNAALAERLDFYARNAGLLNIGRRYRRAFEQMT